MLQKRRLYANFTNVYFDSSVGRRYKYLGFVFSSDFFHSPKLSTLRSHIHALLPIQLQRRTICNVYCMGRDYAIVPAYFSRLGTDSSVFVCDNFLQWRCC